MNIQKKRKILFDLSIDDTLFLKGIAVIFLLLHHLFYVRQELYNDILLYGHHNLVNEIGQFGKCCVAIFVFLSGYGLQKVDELHKVGTSQFYVHRFVKLYSNFWLIWLLFVPISILIFGRTLNEAYGCSIVPKIVLDFWGVLNIFGLYGYNPTWWFYSTIIILYLLFPFLKRFVHYPFFLIMFGVGGYYLSIFNSTFFYLLPFILGLVFAAYRNEILFPAITPPYKWMSIFILLAILLVVFLERIKAGDKILYDSFIVLILIVEYKLLYIPLYIKRFFVFLGKHSMNIFLFHTFIFLYWFKDVIYFTRNPFLIFISLLLPCMVVSILIEKLKALIHFGKLNEKIEFYLCRIIKK